MLGGSISVFCHCFCLSPPLDATGSLFRHRALGTDKKVVSVRRIRDCTESSRSLVTYDQTIGALSTWVSALLATVVAARSGRRTVREPARGSAARRARIVEYLFFDSDSDPVSLGDWQSLICWCLRQFVV